MPQDLIFLIFTSVTTFSLLLSNIMVWRRKRTTPTTDFSGVRPDVSKMLSRYTTRNGQSKAVRNMLKTLHFSHYQENSLCDLLRGLDEKYFGVYVDNLARQLKLSSELTNSMKLARNADYREREVRNFYQHDKDGLMYFGRIATIRHSNDNGIKYDIAYSLHTLEYRLAGKISDNMTRFLKFAQRVKTGKAEEDQFSNYFQNKAAEIFTHRCGKLLDIKN